MGIKNGTRENVMKIEVAAKGLIIQNGKFEYKCNINRRKYDLY